MTEWPLRKGTMHYFISFFFLLSLSFGVFPNENKVEIFSAEKKLLNIPLKESVKKSVLNGEIFSESNVKSYQNKQNQREQNLNFNILGFHPKSCNFAMKKLSRYQDYKKFVDFIKESDYDEKTGELNFLLSHSLLPYNMRLIFKLPRITGPGTYPYSFEIGILKGLKGSIQVLDFKNRCLFYTDAHWSGPHTGFPNIIFEFFSQVLAKKSMEILFRVSTHL